MGLTKLAAPTCAHCGVSNLGFCHSRGEPTHVMGAPDASPRKAQGRGALLPTLRVPYTLMPLTAPHPGAACRLRRKAPGVCESFGPPGAPNRPLEDVRNAQDHRLRLTSRSCATLRIVSRVAAAAHPLRTRSPFNELPRATRPIGGQFLPHDRWRDTPQGFMCTSPPNAPMAPPRRPPHKFESHAR